MHDGFAAESLRRQEDYRNMQKTMTAKMEEGFRSEQQARQQAQSEMMKGLKDEENARQEEMKSLKIGNGRTVCSGRHLCKVPAFVSRYSEMFIPRKMEFKGWVTGYKKCSFQDSRPTRSRISSEIYKRCCRVNFTSTLTGTKPGQKQGNWPTKTFVKMWFENETNMATMIGMLGIGKHELKKIPCKLHDEVVCAKFGNDPLRGSPWQRPMLCFTKVSKKWGEMNP